MPTPFTSSASELRKDKTFTCNFVFVNEYFSLQKKIIILYLCSVYLHAYVVSCITEFFLKKGVFFQVLTGQVMSWFYECCVLIPDTKNEA